MLKLLIVALAGSSLVACFDLKFKTKGQTKSLTGEVRVVKATQITEEKTVSKFNASATSSQQFQVSESGSLAGSAVTFPPGALQISTDIVLEEAATLQQTSLVSELGLAGTVTLNSATTGMIIRPTTVVQLSQPLTINMPLPTNLSAWLFGTENYVVFYKQYKESGLESGIIPSDKIEIINDLSGTTARFSGYFGAYWVVKVETPILEEKKVASTEPIVNSKNVVVIEEKGIISEAVIVQKQTLPEVQWGPVSLDFTRSTRTLTVQGSLAQAADLTTCKADFGKKQDDLNSIATEASTNLTANYVWPDITESDAVARFRCVDSSGRITLSPWSSIYRIPAKSILPLTASLTSPIYASQLTSLAPQVSGASSFSWDTISGPGLITFGSPQASTTTVSASVEGPYSLRLRLTNDDQESKDFEMKFIWDTTAPTQPSQIAFARTVSNQLQNTVTWINSTDANFQAHEVKVCTANDCLVGCRTPVTSSSSPLSLTLVDGDQVYACVRGLDLAGQASAWVSSAQSLRIDTSAPTITGLSTSLSNGYYAAGTNIPLTLSFQKAMTSPAPNGVRIPLDTSASALATYVSGNGTASWTFTYTVQAGDMSPDLNYQGSILAIDAGSTPLDALGSPLVNALPSPSGPNSLAAQKDIVILTSAPSAPSSPGFSAAQFNTRALSWSWSNGTVPYLVQNISMLCTTGDCTQGCTSPITQTAAPGTTGTTSTPVPADGTYYGCVKNRDAAGNESSTWAVTLSPAAVDTLAPTAPTTVSLAAGSHSWNASVSWYGSNDGAVATSLYEAKLCPSSCEAMQGCSSSVPFANTTSGELSAPIAGTYLACVRSLDAANNKSAWASSSSSLTLSSSDTTPPVISNPNLNLSTQADGNLTINWYAATDNITQAAYLLYSPLVQEGNCPASAESIVSIIPLELMGGTSANLSLSPGKTYCISLKVQDEASNTAYYQMSSTSHKAPLINGYDLAGSLGQSSQRKTFYHAASGTHWMFHAVPGGLRVYRSSDAQTWMLASNLSMTIKDFSITLGTVQSQDFAYLAYSDADGDIWVQRGALSANGITFETAVRMFDGTVTEPFYERPSIALDKSNDPSLWLVASSRSSTAQGKVYGLRYQRIVPDLSSSSVGTIAENETWIRDLSLTPDDAGGVFLVSNSMRLTTYYLSPVGVTNVSSDETDWKRFLNRSFRGEVYAMALVNGTLYVGGHFQFVDLSGQTIRNIAKWDGTSWQALKDGCEGTVRQMLSDTNGRIYVQGISPSEKSYLRSWNNNQWTDIPVEPMLSFDNIETQGLVTSISIDSQNRLLVGGAFSRILVPEKGYINAQGLIRWDPSNDTWTEISSPWSASQPRAIIQSMLWSSGKLYANYHQIATANEFWNQRSALICHQCNTWTLGQFQSFPAAWDGANWTLIEGPANISMQFVQLVRDTSTLYGLGYTPVTVKPQAMSSSTYTVAIPKILKLADGGVWQDLTPNSACNSELENNVAVNRFCDSGIIFAAGMWSGSFYVSAIPTRSFAQSAGSSPWPAQQAQFMRANADNTWTPAIPTGGRPILSTISTLNATGSGTLYVGGSFNQFGNTNFSGLVAMTYVNGTMTNISSLPSVANSAPSQGPNGPVNKIHIGSQDTALISGSFTQVNDVNSRYIAKYQAGTFTPLTGLTAEPQEIRLAPDGTPYAAVNNALYRWTGSSWTLLQAFVGLLSSFEVGTDNSVWVSGNLRPSSLYQSNTMPAWVYDPALNQWTGLGTVGTSGYNMAVSNSQQMALLSSSDSNPYGSNLILLLCNKIDNAWGCSSFPSVAQGISMANMSAVSLVWGSNGALYGAGLRNSDHISFVAAWTNQSGSWGWQNLGLSAAPPTYPLLQNDRADSDKIYILGQENMNAYDTTPKIKQIHWSLSSASEASIRSWPAPKPSSTNILQVSYYPQFYLRTSISSLGVFSDGSPFLGGTFTSISDFPSAYLAQGYLSKGRSGASRGISTVYDSTLGRLSLLSASPSRLRLQNFVVNNELSDGFDWDDPMTNFDTQQPNLSLQHSASGDYLNIYWLNQSRIFAQSWNLSSHSFDPNHLGYGYIRSHRVREFSVDDTDFNFYGNATIKILLQEDAPEARIRWMRIHE